MRKRTSRPPRFAAVDNKAIDTLPSILAVGLLTRLIRARDGEDVTVESLSRNYAEGEEALSKAMRALVEAANVVKFKVQRATTEEVEEPDGSRATKRGGGWWTTFSVDSVPFTAEDVAAMVADIRAQGNVRAIRVEPTRLDPDPAAANRPHKQPVKGGKRPTPGNPGVGPTCGNVPEVNEDAPRPTPGFPGAGRPAPGGPAPGQGGALFKGKTETTETDEPSLPPSLFDSSTRASAARKPDGGTDGGGVDRRERQESGVPQQRGGAATAAPVASEGVLLLMEIARREPRATIVGDLLNKLGLHLEGLLAAGWAPDLLIPQVIAQFPPPEEVRFTDAAIVAARIRAIPGRPPLASGPAPAPASQSAPAWTPPTPPHHECPGQDGTCGRQVSGLGMLCSACRTPCSTEDCGRSRESGHPSGMCRECNKVAADAALPRCQDGCDRAAVFADGRCQECHRAWRNAQQERAAREAAEQEQQRVARLAQARLGGGKPAGPARPGGCGEGCEQLADGADGRCARCREIREAYENALDEYAPAYAHQGPQAPF